MKNSDPHDELEKMLGSLRPSEPGEELMSRLRAARPQSTAKVVRFPFWIPLSAVAAVALGVMIFSTPSSRQVDAGKQAAAETTRIPLENRQHLMEVTDFGVVQDRSERPVRLIRTTWLDEFVYATGPGGPQVTESRVRQEVLPVSLDIY